MYLQPSEIWIIVAATFLLGLFIGAWAGMIAERFRDD